MGKWMILLSISIACCIVDMFPKRTKVEKTLICSQERGKEVDMFPITNKGYMSVDTVIHTIFSSHCETVCLLSKKH